MQNETVRCLPSPCKNIREDRISNLTRDALGVFNSDKLGPHKLFPMSLTSRLPDALAFGSGISEIDSRTNKWR